MTDVPPTQLLTPEELEALVQHVTERVIARLRPAELRPRVLPSSSLAADELSERIASFLAEHGPALLPDIARAARVRHQAVRDILKSDARFFVATTPPERSRRGIWWATYRQAASGDGTSADECGHRGTGHR